MFTCCASTRKYCSDRRHLLLNRCHQNVSLLLQPNIRCSGMFKSRPTVFEWDLKISRGQLGPCASNLPSWIVQKRIFADFFLHLQEFSKDGEVREAWPIRDPFDMWVKNDMSCNAGFLRSSFAIWVSTCVTRAHRPIPSFPATCPSTQSIPNFVDPVSSVTIAGHWLALEVVGCYIHLYPRYDSSPLPKSGWNFNVYCLCARIVVLLQVYLVASCYILSRFHNLLTSPGPLPSYLHQRSL